VGAINRVFNRGRLKREQRANRKELRKQTLSHSSKFILEPLEPRLLLSADVVPPIVAPDLSSSANADSSPLVANINDAQSAGNFHILAATSPLVVNAFNPNSSGFTARFNRPVDATALNLYDTETAGLGAADVSIVGNSQGAVKGSLIVNGDSLSFVKTGGVLAPDTYTVTLDSANNGFKDLSGNLLDGNNDGTAGDNFVTSFTVDSSSAVVVGLPDFARGPGQVINVPGTASGLPITLSDGTGITSVSLTLSYDPALLIVDVVRKVRDEVSFQLQKETDCFHLCVARPKERRAIRWARSH
jgi:hypothetical protein